MSDVTVDSVKDYEAQRETPLTDAEVGFLTTVHIDGMRVSEVNAILESARNLSGGTIRGLGDKFRAWCAQYGRRSPSDTLVAQLNRDPNNGVTLAAKRAPEEPGIYRSFTSFKHGR